MPHAHVNGQRLFYQDSGGNHPALLFSHGLLMDHAMFAPQVAAFRDRYRCIAWDECGHGQTAGDSIAPFSYYDSADDAAALLRHLGIEQAVLIGMSQGGYLSQRVALRHPQVVRALVLIDTQSGPEDATKMPGYLAMIDDWCRNGLSEQTATIIEQIILGNGWNGAAEWRAKWATWQPHNLAACFATLGERDDISESVRAIRAPTLAIHGADDVAISVARAQAMVDAIPGARLEVIPGAGHAANLTHPEAVNPLIDAFLQQLP